MTPVAAVHVAPLVGLGDGPEDAAASDTEAAAASGGASCCPPTCAGTKSKQAGQLRFERCHWFAGARQAHPVALAVVRGRLQRPTGWQAVMTGRCLPEYGDRA